ncbi:unnamed protein product [Ixodes persulcatus]
MCDARFCCILQCTNSRAVKKGNTKFSQCAQLPSLEHVHNDQPMLSDVSIRIRSLCAGCRRGTIHQLGCTTFASKCCI